MKLLLVENDATFAETVCSLFLDAHSVTVIPTVMEALDMFRAGSFDAVLVDYDLDDFKGDAFVRRLRSAGISVPIVGVSARDTGNTKLLDAGADAVCHKAEFASILDVLSSVVSPSG